MPIFKLGRAVLEFAGDKTQLEAALKAAGIDVKSFKKETEGATGTVGKFASSLKGVGALIGVSFTVGAVVNFTKKVFDAASAINDQSKSLGFGAENFQRYAFAAKQSGADQEIFTKSASVLNDKLAGGDKSTVAALKKAGLEYESIRAMKPDQAFLAVSNAVGKIEDPMLRANVAQDLFGKGALKLLPGMIEGYEKLGAGAKVMSDETIRRLEAAQDEWEAFANSVVIHTGEILGAIAGLGEEASKSKAFQLVFLPPNASAALRAQILAELPKEPFKGALDRFGVGALNEAQAKALGILSSAPGFVARIKAAREQLSRLTAEQREQLDAAQQLEGQFTALANSYDLSADAQKIYTSNAKDTEKALKDQADAAKKLLDLQNKIYGRDLIARANEMAAALGDTGDVTRLLPGMQKDFLGTVDSAIAAYQRLGEVAPSALLSIRDALVPLVAVNELAEGVETNVNAILFRLGQLGTKVGRLLPSITTVPFDPSALQGTRVNLGRPSLARLLGIDLEADGHEFSQQLGPTVLQALTGGGSVSQSIGGLAGMQIGKSLSTTFGGVIKKGLGEKIGGALGSFIPGIGALIGPLLGKGLSALGGLFGIGPSEMEKVRQARAEWLKAAGGLDKLNKSVGAVAGDPKVRAAWNDLFNAKKLKDYEAALAAFNTTVAEAQAALQLRLGEEQEARDFLQATVEKYGFTIDQLGDKWKQQALTDEAMLLVREYTALTRSGIDHNLVIEKMGENMNTFFLKAIKTGVEVPKQLRPLLQQMIDQGTLIDENGQAFDSQALDAVHWSQTLTEQLQLVIDKLGELVDVITGKLGKAIEEIPTLEIPVAPLSNRQRAFNRARGLESFATEAFVRRPTMALVGDVPGGEFVLKPSTIAGWLDRAAGSASEGLNGDRLGRQIAAAIAPALQRDGEDFVLVVDGEVLGRVVGRHRATQEELSRGIALNTFGLGTAVRQASS